MARRLRLILHVAVFLFQTLLLQAAAGDGYVCWMDGCMDGWIHESMDGWMGWSLDELVDELVSIVIGVPV